MYNSAGKFSTFVETFFPRGERGRRASPSSVKRAFVGAFGTSSAKEGRGFVWVRHWQTPTVWRGLFSPVALASAIIDTGDRRLGEKTGARFLGINFQDRDFNDTAF